METVDVTIKGVSPLLMHRFSEQEQAKARAAAGRPDELVRGVDIVGTPLTAMGSIMMTSREVETFNGMCGAESGWVPVSASAQFSATICPVLCAIRRLRRASSRTC